MLKYRFVEFVLFHQHGANVLRQRDLLFLGGIKGSPRHSVHEEKGDKGDADQHRSDAEQFSDEPPVTSAEWFEAIEQAEEFLAAAQESKP